MKVLTLWQPHASLCVIINPATGEPYKTIETRGWTPPASLIGQRVALHAAASENWREGQQVGDWLCYRTSKTHQARMYCRTHRPMVVALPLGAIVATATLADVLPIVRLGEETAVRRIEVATMGGQPNLMLCAPDPSVALYEDGTLDLTRDAEAGVDFDPSDYYEQDVTDQRPYGDYRTPPEVEQRYAWLLADVQAVDPEPFKGGQGLTRTWQPHMEAVH